jgi:hypothetical protein
VFDFLMSADLKVRDPDAMAERLRSRLGVLHNPNWRMGFASTNYVAWFLRVQKSLAVAPTRIEPQGHFDGPCTADPAFSQYLDSVWEFQGDARPVKTHSTILITSEFDEFVTGLARRGVPYRIAPIRAEMPFPRLWVGVTAERPRYDPSWDGGLCIEVMPYWPLQMPDDTRSAPEPVDPVPGELLRVAHRGFLVRDLDDVLGKLDRNLDWQPPGPVESFRDEGFRRARFTFGLPHSATLDLIEPSRWDSAEGRFLATWGPGPSYIRIAVNGLDAKAEDLRARGTRFTDVDAIDSVGRRLVVEPDDLDGAWFEFVEP